MTFLTYNAYHVGIICALKVELAAMRAMLDEEHGRPDEQDPNDHNVYFAGCIHTHNVVIACLPAGTDGLAAAATVANNMLRTFPQLRFGLLVGIGGGIPNLEKDIDIRLGDVVVSQPQGTHGGVVQYDKGKGRRGMTWERKGFLNAPPTFLLTALQSLQAEHELKDSLVPSYLNQMTSSQPKTIGRGYTYPGIEKDVFDDSSSLEPTHSKKRKRPLRDERTSTDPVIHYGIIASGNTVVKDASLRDSIRDECGALCVEMEAAGLVNDFPCLVIRGIADYADDNKNDQWHRYAAATAAAFAKELLLHVSSSHVVADSRMRDILDALKSQTKDTVEFVRSQEEERLYQNCHQSFYTSTYVEYKELNPPAVPGTCQWLLGHPKFLEWYANCGDTLLWLSADPGCGKSVLARHLVDVVLRTQPDSETLENPHTVCYFFFKDNSNQDCLSTALSAVLHQIFTQQPELIRYAIPAYKTAGGQLSGEVGQLWNILLNAVRDYNAESIICIFDGLDECRIGDRKRLIDFLCRFYSTRARSSMNAKKGLKFFVTSRPYDDIETAFEHVPADLPSIRLRGEDENDQIHNEINLVIEAYMVKLSKDLRLSPENTQRIKQKLLDMENRTYLWLYLVIDHIKKTFGRSFRPDSEQIIVLPRSVDEAYEQLLTRVEENSDEGQVKIILSIILGSRRALSVSEMALALDIATSSSKISSLGQFSIDPKNLGDKIRHWCELFIFINHGYIYLLHQTAKEFLLRHNFENAPTEWRWKQCLPRIEVEKVMATICVDYLNITEFNEAELNGWMKSQDVMSDRHNGRSGRDREFSGRSERLAILRSLQITEPFIGSAVSFFEYAAKHWAHHVRLAEQTLNAQTRRQSLKLYKCASLRFGRMNQFSNLRSLQGDSYTAHAVLLAAHHGHSLALGHLLDQLPEEVNVRDVNSDKTPLILAAEEGHIYTVEQLLSQGADIGSHFSRGKTALSEASYRGQLEVTRILLEAGSRSQFELGIAFLRALKQGHTSIAPVLFDAGLDVDAALEGWGLPLNPEEMAKDNALMTRLRQLGISLDEYNGWGTALHMAVWKRDMDLVAEMIKRGANVNAKCVKTGSVLRTTCLIGDDKIFQMLWDKQAGVDAVTGLFYDTDAFLTAVLYSNPKTVRKFLKRGIDINKEGGSGQTALQAACLKGDEDIVRLLLERGANVNAYSKLLGTALHAASEKGWAGIVRLLIMNQADLAANCTLRGTALHAAAANGHEGVAKLLLEAGINVDELGGRCGTALQGASLHGHGKTVEVLLNEGANVNESGGQYHTALHAAAFHGHADVVKTLLDAGADANIQAPSFGTAFDIAFSEGHDHVTSILVSYADNDQWMVNLNLRDDYEAIMRLAENRENRDFLRDWLDYNIQDYIRDSDDDYRRSEDMSVYDDNDPFCIFRNEHWSACYDWENAEDWDQHGYGWDGAYYEGYGDGIDYEHTWITTRIPSTPPPDLSPPSDLVSEISMPDSFVYEDLNLSSAKGGFTNRHELGFEGGWTTEDIGFLSDTSYEASVSDNCVDDEEIHANGEVTPDTDGTIE